MFSSPARKPNLKQRAKKPSIAINSVQERHSMVGLCNFSASKNIFAPDMLAPEIITQNNTSVQMSVSRRDSTFLGSNQDFNLKVK
jgi:hypothetical protein